MFGNQEELTKQIPNQMIISLIGANYLHESITSSVLDISEGDYSNRLRVISLLNFETLQKKAKEKDTWGLVNLNWLKKTLCSRPATIILVYDVRSKPENISWKDYENSICIDISKAKKTDNYPFLNIVLLIYASSSSFSFDNVSEDKERSYNIKKVVDSKNIIYIGSENLKGIAKKLSSHLLKITLNYYRTIKKNLKIKKNNSSETKEKLIKYNIKLGVISQVKNKRRSWKYFDDAYNLVAMLDIKNYFYGNQSIKLNYFELKAVADWLFFKIFNLKSNDVANLPSLVSTFNSHMANFSKVDLLKDDKMLVVDYFWRHTRHEFFAKFLEETNKSEFYTKSIFNFPGTMQTINTQGLSNPSLSLVSPTNLKMRDNKYIGKPPKFYELVDPLTEKDHEFNENLWLKHFLAYSNISLEPLCNKLIEQMAKSEKLYTEHFLTEKPNQQVNSSGASTMTIFFNILSILHNNSLSKNCEKLKYLYKTFLSSPWLSKFPLLVLKYSEDYYKILISDKENFSDNSQAILEALINISEFRSLSVPEEKMLFSILNDTGDIRQKISIKKTNRILSFDYTVSNNTPTTFDLVDYTFKIKSELSLDSIKIKSINFFFNNPDRNKAFFDTFYSLNKDNELSFSYKLLIKEGDKHLKLKSVRFELQNKEEKSIYLELDLKTEKEKEISLKNINSNILDFVYQKSTIIGKDQFCKIECEIIKTDKSINVDDLKMRFTLNTPEEENLHKTHIHNAHRSVSFSSIPNKKIEPRDSIITLNDESVFKAPSLSLVEHEIVVKSSDGSLTTHQNSVIMYLKEVEGKCKCSFLVKFKELGNFSFTLESEYKLSKSEVYDDASSLYYTGPINIEVKTPFEVKFDLFASSYMSLQMQKVYCVDNLVNLNSVITNNLGSDLELTNLSFEPKHESIKISSLMTRVILEHFTIMKNSEFLIPFKFKTSTGHSGSLGKFTIEWRDSNLKAFDPNLFNTTEFVFPDVNVKSFDISLSYEIPKVIQDKREVMMRVNITNNTSELKRLVFLIDTSSNLVISGTVNKKLLLHPNEKKNLNLEMTPVTFGKIKLPLFKVMDYPLASTNYENKIYSIYMIPESITVQGSQ